MAIVDADAIKVQSDRTFITNRSGVAYQFHPVRGNVGGYPLKVFHNDETHRYRWVRGPGVYRCAEGFTKLRVDATEGGGAPDDYWEVTVFETQNDRIEEVERNDYEGYQQTRAADPVVLMDLRAATDPAPFMLADAEKAAIEALGVVNAGNFDLLPPAERWRGYPHFGPRSGPTAQDCVVTFKPWDLSRFTRATFFLSTLGVHNDLNGSYRMFADLLSGPERDALILHRIGAGTVNQFGNAGGDGSYGIITIGASTARQDSYTTDDTRWSPWVRFSIAAENGLQADNGSGGFRDIKVGLYGW